MEGRLRNGNGAGSPRWFGYIGGALGILTLLVSVTLYVSHQFESIDKHLDTNGVAIQKAIDVAHPEHQRICTNQIQLDQALRLLIAVSPQTHVRIKAIPHPVCN